MRRDELDLAIDWAAAEGWNPGMNDADCYYAADPQGFFVGLLDTEPVACISTIRYDSKFGFLGFYIVKPGQRGKGYGMRIWNAGLNYLRGCNIGLDGVIDQQENYKRSGFKLAYRNIRYECQARAGGADEGLAELASLPLECVLDYDEGFFPAPRRAFSSAWISQPDCASLGLVRDGDLAGMGVLRPCRSGCKIGPLYAADRAGAERIFAGLQSRIAPGTPVYLDVPETNPAAIALARAQGMSPCFETARMYTGPQPELPLENVYGVTSFEIG